MTIDRTPITWQIHSTLPLSGEENMRIDSETLARVERGESPPTLRFFRFSEPTVTYGRLQDRSKIRSRIPAGWPAVRRPTGGGLVFHENDLCLSLCWPNRQPPLPQHVSQIYVWIHQEVRDAVRPLISLNKASCRQTQTDRTPFALRECFTAPVPGDLLLENRKIVGGAICRTKDAFLYQGTLQGFSHPRLEAMLDSHFSHLLHKV